MPSEYVKIRAWVQMSAIAGSNQEETIEFPRSEWDAMDDEQRANVLTEAGLDLMASKVECGAYVDED